MDINKRMQDAFNQQITKEFYAANVYLSMAFWFRKEGWKGFASWMLKQAEEEKAHALDMANFVLDRGGVVEIDTIEAVKAEFAGPKEVFEEAMAQEKRTTEYINQLADVADQEGDRAAQNFIGRYIDEQVEEEKTMRDILNLFRHRDGHTVANIDDILNTRA